VSEKRVSEKRVPPAENSATHIHVNHSKDQKLTKMAEISDTHFHTFFIKVAEKFSHSKSHFISLD